MVYEFVTKSYSSPHLSALGSILGETNAMVNPILIMLVDARMKADMTRLLCRNQTPLPFHTDNLIHETKTKSLSGNDHSTVPMSCTQKNAHISS